MRGLIWARSGRRGQDWPHPVAADLEVEGDRCLLGGRAEDALRARDRDLEEPRGRAVGRKPACGPVIRHGQGQVGWKSRLRLEAPAGGRWGPGAGPARRSSDDDDHERRDDEELAVPPSRPPAPVPDSTRVCSPSAERCAQQARRNSRRRTMSRAAGDPPTQRAIARCAATSYAPATSCAVRRSRPR